LWKIPTAEIKILFNTLAMFPKTCLTIFLILTLSLSGISSSAQILTDSLPHFNKIQVSPKINLVLNQGEKEYIRIEYDGIESEKINYSVKGNKLRIYLEDAKYTIKTEEIIKDGNRQKVPIYRDARVTAYVSYKSLKNIQVRGEETVICHDSLISRKFKIRLFGESRLELAFLQSRHLKVHAFGENKLTIRGGDSDIQTYRLFGENKISTENMAADRIKASSFGESSLALFATEEIRLWGFGEVDMQYAGDPYFRKLIVGTLSTTVE
jgi:HSP20 family molecular chaperone IbpA